MRFALPNIRHDRATYEALARLFAESDACFGDTIEIDMGERKWFAADMCAVFGAILYRSGENLNTSRLTNLHPNVHDILSKNGFLSHYGEVRMPDRREAAISYQRFGVEDSRSFAEYIEEELTQKTKMSLVMSRKIGKIISEIFDNSVLHSETESGIFSCGYYVPHQNRLSFTLVDLGMGMRQNIKRYANLDLPPEEAIDWAITGNNTTKQKYGSGGLGLKLLQEFIDLNNGGIQIMSDAGYWCREERRTDRRRLAHQFLGTAVSVGINTADSGSYSLASELATEEIF